MALKIAYNAGHILATPGKRLPKQLDPNETREWTLNDRVARYFAAEMSRYDGVELRRMDDPNGVEPIDIDERVAMANEWPADFYLSIHHNAAGVIFNGGGIVAFIYDVGGMSEKYAKAIYKACIDATGLKGNRATPIATKEQMNLYECRATTMPAVLMEYGFMDSTVDAPIILTDDFARKAGTATAQAIAQMHNLKLKASEEGKFTDVSDSAWYAEDVYYCAEHGLMNGVGNGQFNPEAPIKRAEVAAVVARLHRELSK